MYTCTLQQALAHYNDIVCPSMNQIYLTVKALLNIMTSKNHGKLIEHGIKVYT